MDNYFHLSKNEQELIFKLSCKWDEFDHEHVTQEEKTEQESYEAGEVCKPLKISLNLKFEEIFTAQKISEVDSFPLCVRSQRGMFISVTLLTVNSSTLTYGGL